MEEETEMEMEMPDDENELNQTKSAFILEKKSDILSEKALNKLTMS